MPKQNNQVKIPQEPEVSVAVGQIQEESDEGQEAYIHHYQVVHWLCSSRDQQEHQAAMIAQLPKIVNQLLRRRLVQRGKQHSQKNKKLKGKKKKPKNGKIPGNVQEKAQNQFDLYRQVHLVHSQQLSLRQLQHKSARAIFE